MTTDKTKAAKSGVKSTSVGQVQSLARGLSILKVLAHSDHAMTLSEVCDQVHLASSTAHRLLSSLEQQNFVAQEEQRGRWSIGVEAFTVGNGYLKTRDVVTIARPYMRVLMEQTGETCNLGILDKESSVLIAQIECKEMMRMVAKLGGRTPVHASGIGKAILSQQPPLQIEELLAQIQLTPLTEKTIVDNIELVEHLKLTAQRGYSIDDEEQSSGLRCIASPIYNEHGEAVAAVSISGPRIRINDQRIDSLGQLLKETAAEITLAMGGKLQ